MMGTVIEFVPSPILVTIDSTIEMLDRFVIQVLPQCISTNIKLLECPCLFGCLRGLDEICQKVRQPTEPCF